MKGLVEFKTLDEVIVKGKIVLVRVDFNSPVDPKTKKILDAQWASLVYHGEWFHPLKTAIDAFIEATQRVVSGTYVVDLYKGTVEIVSRQSPASLFFPEVRSIASSSFNQTMCGPAAHIRGLPYQLLAKREANLAQAETKSMAENAPAS